MTQPTQTKTAIDLDALERELSLVRPSWHPLGPRERVLCALPALIAELRAARRVVEAAREVPKAVNWLEGMSPDEPVHPGVVAIFQALAEAVAEVEHFRE